MSKSRQIHAPLSELPPVFKDPQLSKMDYPSVDGVRREVTLHGFCIIRKSLIQQLYAPAMHPGLRGNLVEATFIHEVMTNHLYQTAYDILSRELDTEVFKVIHFDDRIEVTKRND